MQTVFLLVCPPKPPIWFGKSQTTCWISCLAKVSKVVRNIYYQMVINWQFSTSLHSNVQHIRKQIWRNYAKIYQRFLIHARSIPCIFVNLSVLENGIHDAESVATTELQWIPSVLIQPSDSMFSDHTLPRICVCSNMCVKIPHKDCRFSSWYS